MKINNKVLSLPPYISTSWKNINSILVDTNGNLIILLHSKAKIVIPNLEKSVINVIFDTHAKYVEEESAPNIEKPQLNPANPSSSPLHQLSIGPDGITSLGKAFEHNKDKQAPPMPDEILKKITSIFKIMGIDNPDILPKAEPHCNCVHCQIARAINGEEKMTASEELNDLEVTEEDLKFRTWDINQTEKNLYEVINPLDKNEKYNVYLGKPLGCTCGEKNCEHIRAVLNS